MAHSIPENSALLPPTFYNLQIEESPICSIPSELITHLLSLLTTGRVDLICFGATCKRFFNNYLQFSPKAFAFHHLFSKLEAPAKHLIDAAYHRELTPTERSSLRLPAKPFVSIAKEAFQASIVTSNAEESFNKCFQVFQEQMNALNIHPTHPNYEIYIQGFHKIFNKTVIKTQPKTDISKIFDTLQLTIKLNTLTDKFNQKSLNQMYQAYASEPLGNITIDSFKQQVALIKVIFPGQTTASVEAGLRKAILSAHPLSELSSI